MKNLTARALSCILALAICIGLLPGLSFYVSSAETPANTGVRGEIAVSPSANAADFYTGDYTFEALMGLSGSSSDSTTTVAQSALYGALQDLMTSKHTHNTSYSETRDYYKYTDCQNGNVSAGISCFYSGVTIGPEWDGTTWNREHTWPNSKGLDGDDENDLMMLRPTDSTENSARGNKAYGESDGFYNPNDTSNGALNLHGDVVRIMLYVYVRWGNTGLFGADGVLESKDVMLKWMEEDPVDTWELSRVDVVQSVTGTRNVFVDYPELVFQLFGEAVPAGMASPSAGAGTGATATTITYSENGATWTFNTFEGNKTALGQPTKAPADGWSFAGWTDAAIDGSTTAKPATVYAPGSEYTVPAGGATLYALYTKFEGSGAANTYALADALVGGEKVILYAPASGNAVSNVIASTTKLKPVAVTAADGSIATTDASIVWTVTKNADGTYGFSNGASVLSFALSGTQGQIKLDGTDASFVLESVDATAKTYRIYSSTLTTSFGNTYLEYYSGNFTAYSTGTSNLNDAYLFNFYTASGTDYYATTTEKAAEFTVSFSTPAHIATPESIVADSMGCALPVASASEDWTFAGWVTETVDNASEAPATVYAAGSTYVPTADITFKALYTKAGSEMTKVTDVSTLTAGTKLIIGHEASGAVAGGLSTTTSKYLLKLDATFANGVITALPSDAAIFTLGGEAGAWTLTTDAGDLSITSHSNNKLSFTNENKYWDITITEGVLTVANTLEADKNGRVDGLFYNTNVGQERFSNYKIGGTSCVPVELYLAPASVTYTTEVAPPEATVSFSVPAGVEAVAPMTTVNNAITLPTAGNPAHQIPDSSDGWSFVGWTTAKLEETEAKPEILTGTYSAYEDVTLYAVYSKTVTEGVGGSAYTLLTDASTLTAGTKLVIGHAASGAVAGTIASGTKFLAKLDATFADGVITSLPTDAAIFTLGGEAGAWTLTTDAGDLAITAHSNNRLAFASENNTWVITIADGVTTIANTLDYPDGSRVDGLFYNTGSPRFANYKIGGTSCLPAELYALTTVESSTSYWTTEIACPHSFTAQVATKDYEKTPATCTSYAEYYYSCEYCGEASTTDTFNGTEYAAHEYTVAKYDEADHWNECSCGAVDTKIKHTLTLGCDAAQHWYSCSCGYEEGRVGHSGGASGCTVDGKCTVCETAYLPANGHAAATYVPEVEADCCTTGVKAHYHCDACNADYLEKTVEAVAQSEKDLEIAIDPTAHKAGSLTHNTLVEATEDAEGLAEHWYCKACEKYFSDAEGEVEVTYESLIIPKLSTVLYGDVNGDGEITAADASLVLQYDVKLKDLTDEQKKAANVNTDAVINAQDASLILQFNVKLIQKFPIEAVKAIAQLFVK